MDDSDTSSLSSVAPDEEIQKLAPIFLKAKRATKKVAPPPVASPPRPKRDPSPPHEDVFADNPDIAFLVMFRSRFADAFPSKLAHFGPQDIERAISEPAPTAQAEALLCTLLGLVLNRKKPVEQGHHGRALEEALTSHKSQWPSRWEGRNPLSGSRDFNSMSPEERLYLLRTLVMWSLTSSEEISTIIKENYKQNRHNDDENQPLSIQPWGRDGDKRRYFLIEGQDDTSFRVYREGPRLAKKVQWYSLAGDIDEVKELANKLETIDGSQAARTLSARMLNAVPRFEATEEKRKRREYRQMRRAQFTRPEPGFSLYEGRTRGKRMRYTFDDEDAFSDDGSARRSGRTSDRDIPTETEPVTTLSGRQVKPRRGGEYGASLHSGQIDSLLHDELDTATDDSAAPQTRARPLRTAGRSTYQYTNKRKFVVDDDDVDEGFSTDDDPSGAEWDSDANGKDDYDVPDADDEDEDDIEPWSEDDIEPRSLIVRLKVSPQSDISGLKPATNGFGHDSLAGQPNNYAAAGLTIDHQPKPKHEPEYTEQTTAFQQELPTSEHTSSDATHDLQQDTGSGQTRHHPSYNGLHITEHESSTIDQFDSPMQQQAPVAQISMSGYPTPASLPPPAFKHEIQAAPEGLAISTVAQPVASHSLSYHPASAQSPFLATYTDQNG